jgi:hypothetical protein
MFYTPLPLDLLEQPNVILFPMYSGSLTPNARVVELLRLVSAGVIPRIYFTSDAPKNTVMGKKLNQIITSNVKDTLGASNVRCSALSFRRDRMLICVSYFRETFPSGNPDLPQAVG